MTTIRRYSRLFIILATILIIRTIRYSRAIAIRYLGFPDQTPTIKRYDFAISASKFNSQKLKAKDVLAVLQSNVLLLPLQVLFDNEFFETLYFKLCLCWLH